VTASEPAPEARPFPPGEYPVVVVGSGPGALQLAYSLRRLGVGHAVVSEDPSPGGMFRRWPFFQRLLSWTQPFAPQERGTRAYERFDWNSLLADEGDARALQASFMDGTSYFPSRPEMEQNLRAFAERTSLPIRYGCRWTATRREDGPDGERFVLVTADGEYRARVAVFAVGAAQPWTPPTLGIELARHYAETRPVDTYRDRRVFIIGKQNSGFELASGMLPWARRIVLASPSPTKLSVDTRSLVGVRARYVQPYEDHVLGGGVSILDASIERVERQGDALLVRTVRTDGGGELAVEADDVIVATGFTCPLLDLPGLGVAVFGQSKLPAQTAWWESATVPGIFFAGTITQGAKGLRKHGIPSNSGAVHGHRYNARILARELARRYFGAAPERRSLAPDGAVAHLLAEAARAPELWHQKGYLASVLSVTPEDGVRDAGIVPLTTFLDAEDVPDGVAMTLEADGTGAIYPVAYLRRSGKVEEVALEPDPVHDFETAGHHGALSTVLRPLGLR
jgi:thioredoxin reductase